jgi:hypothetical protein
LRASETSPSLDVSQKINQKIIQAKVSEFKLSLLRASETSPSLDVSQKINQKIRPAASCSFKAKCYNSSSRYLEILIDAPALNQVKNKSKENSYIAHPRGQIRAAALKHIVKTQALLTESFGLKP